MGTSGARAPPTRRCDPWPRAAAAVRPRAADGARWENPRRPRGTLLSPAGGADPQAARTRLPLRPRAVPSCGQYCNADLEYFTERFVETRESQLSVPVVIKSSLRTRLRITLRRRRKGGRGSSVRRDVAGR